MNQVPKSFWIISVLALLWNLSGLAAFAQQILMTPADIAALPEAQQALYAKMPSWLNTVFGVATISGTLGVIALLLKKSWAIPLFIISLVAVIIQNIYTLGVLDAMTAYGPSALIMPLLVIIIGAYLIYFSRQAKEKSWIV